MENLHIEGTFKIPEVNFSIDGQLHLRGNAFLHPEPWLFMDRLYAWVEGYSLNPANSTVMSIGIGITGRKCWRKFMRLIEKICTLQDQDHTVYVVWYYQEGTDLDFIDFVEDWLNKLQVPYDIIEVDGFD